jgi:hypothetical protein
MMVDRMLRRRRRTSFRVWRTYSRQTRIYASISPEHKALQERRNRQKIEVFNLAKRRL